MNKIIPIIAVLIVAIVAAIFVFKITFESDHKTPHSESVSVPKAALIDETNRTQVSSNKDNEKHTIANQWQWSALDEGSNATEPEESLPFTSQSVHDALYAVKIDDNGDIILDTDALISLDEALERIYNQLDSESTLKLEGLIRDALPGKVGEQTAKLVSDYSDFLKAKEQFSLLHENTIYVDGVESVAKVERDETLYGDLQALREVHLGTDVAEQLFQEHDATAQYMFDSMKLGLDDSLSPEVKEQRRQEIEARYREVVPLEVSELAPAEDAESGSLPIAE